MKEDKRYKFYTHENSDGSKEVIAVSSYAEKTVKGVAICAPSDTFDVEKGKLLAKLRCDVKVDKKRLKKAEKEYKFLVKYQKQIEEVLRINFDKNQKYMVDSAVKLRLDEEKLNNLLAELSE